MVLVSNVVVCVSTFCDILETRRTKFHLYSFGVPTQILLMSKARIHHINTCFNHEGSFSIDEPEHYFSFYLFLIHELVSCACQKFHFCWISFRRIHISSVFVHTFYFVSLHLSGPYFLQYFQHLTHWFLGYHELFPYVLYSLLLLWTNCNNWNVIQAKRNQFIVINLNIWADYNRQR